MMTEHNIDRREAVALGVFFASAQLFLAFPRTVVELGATAAWIITLIASLVAPLSWVAMRGLLNQHPRRSLITATEAALGPIFGTAVNLIYFAFFQMAAAVALRSFSENFIESVLPNVELEVVVLMLIGTATFVSWLGLEGIARTCWVFGPFALIGLLVLFSSGLLTHTEPGALFPLWGPGVDQVVSFGLIRSSLLAELLILGVIAPSLRSPKELNRAAWTTFIITGVLFTGSVVIFLHIFPYPSAARINFPLLEMSRVIILGRWFQRVESLFLVIWIVSAVLMLATATYGAAATLAQVLQLPHYRFLLYPLATLLYALAMIPDSLPAAVSWDADFLRVYGSGVFILLPALTWLISSIRRKGGTEHDAKET